MAGLQPPRRSTELEDTGTHDIEHSDEEHFSDASEGQKSQASIPTTRVERVDDKPAHGEIPGTAAHSIRTEDASPDQYEVIPESEQVQNGGKAPSIPQTVIDKVEPDQPSHGDVEGTMAYDMRKADAAPDTIRRGPEVTRTDLEDRDQFSEYDENDEAGEAETGGDGDDDDFDAFEEGAEGQDDFGAFDEGDQALEPTSQQYHSDTQTEPILQSSVPLLDFSILDTQEAIASASEPYLNELYPSLSQLASQPEITLPEINQAFLTERSQSLWEQLVAPPPLQPPDWVRSRIRRLFLVSLGVPVDLDEILPASKQKKLILPSIDIEPSGHTSRGEDPRPSNASDKLKASDAEKSARSSSTSKPDRRKKGPPPPPDFDANSARLLCSTTETALSGLSVEELTHHVRRLEDLKQRAGQSLEYWLIQKDSANGDREAFEEVIENLVKHAKKVRK